MEEQGTSTSNDHNPVCGTTGPSLENLTVPPLPREAPTDQPSSSHISKCAISRSLVGHYSCNSSTGTDKLFAKIFPDSQIAKQFRITHCFWETNLDSLEKNRLDKMATRSATRT